MTAAPSSIDHDLILLGEATAEALEAGAGQVDPTMPAVIQGVRFRDGQPMQAAKEKAAG
jgi:hypothetical protein